MKKTLNWQNIILLVATTAVALGYYTLNHETSNLHILSTALDEKIPLVSSFAVPYILFALMFWVLIIYAFITQKRFKALSATTIIVFLISFLFFFFYQTYIPRPLVNGSDTLSSLIRFIYRNDQPYNGFPSLHSSMATIMAMYFILCRSKWSYLYAFFAVIVVLSTLFVKQHFIADAVGGITLGLLISLITYRIIKN